MYTIKMNNDGTLVCTTPSNTLYQTESMVDNIHFILPKVYKDVELEGFEVYAKYVNPANVSKIEILSLNDGNYKENYLEYKLPITTELTKFSGNITLYLTMIKVVSEEVGDEIRTDKYISHSAEITITVVPVNNYFTDTSSLMAIDQRLTQLQEISEKYNTTKADNIELVDNELFLTSNGERLGDSITFENNDGSRIIKF